jgi:hypothetical protein
MSEPFSFALTSETKRPIDEFLDKLGLEKEVEPQATLKALKL